MDQEHCLFFEDYQNTLSERLNDFLNRQIFVNVTLVCDGEKIEAHQTILSAFSPLFENILINRSHPYPTVVFNDVSKEEMLVLLEFMYKGKVSVSKILLPKVLKAAKKLRIRGLEHEENNNSKKTPPDSTESRITVLQEINITPDISLGEKQPENESQPRITSTPQNSTNSPSKSTLSPRNENVLEIPQSVSSLPSHRERRSKVINPFAKLQKSTEDSDSTNCEDNVSLPGPSNKTNSTEKEVVDSSILNNVLKKSPSMEALPAVTSNNDSDVEIIENSTSIVVINDTQINSPEWYRRTIPVDKRKLRRRDKNTASVMEPVEYTSDDSDILSPNVKKRKQNSRKNPIDLDENPETRTVLVNPLALRSKGSKHLNDSKTHSRSQSPELVPQAGTSSANSCKGKQLETNQDSSFVDILNRPFSKLGNFCVACRKFKKNCRMHVKKHHNQQLRSITTCPKCSKKFRFPEIMDDHRCKK